MMQVFQCVPVIFPNLYSSVIQKALPITSRISPLLEQGSQRGARVSARELTAC
jgi:hypothetical protein